MAGRIPVGKAIFMTGVITSLGYGVMALTTPSDQQFYDSLSPDLKKKVDQQRALSAYQKEQQDKLKVIQDNAQDDKPVWNSVTSSSPSSASSTSRR